MTLELIRLRELNDKLQGRAEAAAEKEAAAARKLLGDAGESMYHPYPESLKDAGEFTFTYEADRREYTLARSARDELPRRITKAAVPRWTNSLS